MGKSQFINVSADLWYRLVWNICAR